MVLFWRIVSFGQIIPIIYALRNYRKLENDLRIFTVYMVATVPYSAISWVAARKVQNNLWVDNLFLPITATLLIWMYSEWFKSPRIRLGLLIALILFFGTWVWELFVLHGLFNYSVIVKPFLDFILLSASCLAILYGSRDYETTLDDQPRFWISSAILLTSSGTIMLHMVSRYLLVSVPPHLMLEFLLLQPVIDVVAYIMFIRAYYCQFQLAA
jgi:hypothetical protein